MKKLINYLLAIVVILLIAIAYMKLTKKAADQGAAAVQTSQEIVDKTKKNMEEINKKTNETKKDVDNILGDE